MIFEVGDRVRIKEQPPSLSGAWVGMEGSVLTRYDTEGHPISGSLYVAWDGDSRPDGYHDMRFFWSAASVEHITTQETPQSRFPTMGVYVLDREIRVVTNSAEHTVRPGDAEYAALENLVGRFQDRT